MSGTGSVERPIIHGKMSVAMRVAAQYRRTFEPSPSPFIWAGHKRERERVVYMSEPLVLHFYGIMDEEFYHLSHVAAAKKCRRQKAQIFISLTHKKKNKIVSRPLEIESTLMPEVIAFFSFPSPYIYIYIGQQLVIFSPLRSIRVLSICRNDRTVWGALHQAHLDWILSVCRYRYLL